MSKKLSAKYYQRKNNERLQKKLVKDLTEEEKNKKRQHGCARCKNHSEDGKQKLV